MSNFCSSGLRVSSASLGKVVSICLSLVNLAYERKFDDVKGDIESLKAHASSTYLLKVSLLSA